MKRSSPEPSIFAVRSWYQAEIVTASSICSQFLESKLYTNLSIHGTYFCEKHITNPDIKLLLCQQKLPVLFTKILYSSAPVKFMYVLHNAQRYVCAYKVHSLGNLGAFNDVDTSIVTGKYTMQLTVAPCHVYVSRRRNILGQFRK